MEDLISFLKQSELTKSLSSLEIESLLPFIKKKEFQENEVVFEEGEKSRELYIVKSGSLEVFKEVGELEGHQPLAKFLEGDFFGEMAHLENEPRSASVRCNQKVELLAVDLDALEKKEANQSIYSKIIIQLGKKVSRHLRKVDLALIDSLREKLRYSLAHAHVSKILIYLSVLVSIWFNVFVLIREFPAHSGRLSPVMTPILLTLFGVSAVSIIRSSGYPLSFFGITKNRWFHFFLTGISFSIPLMLFFLLLKWGLVTYVPMFQGIEIFNSWGAITSSFLSIFFYSLFCPVQELIARGTLQSCFHDFFKGTHRDFKAILLSNLMFQMLHTVKDFWLAISTLLIGFLWGHMFAKQRSLVGVSVSHILIGIWNFFILDFGTLVRIFDSYYGQSG